MSCKYRCLLSSRNHWRIPGASFPNTVLYLPQELVEAVRLDHHVVKVDHGLVDERVARVAR